MRDLNAYVWRKVDLRNDWRMAFAVRVGHPDDPGTITRAQLDLLEGFYRMLDRTVMYPSNTFMNRFIMSRPMLTLNFVGKKCSWVSETYIK